MHLVVVRGGCLGYMVVESCNFVRVPFLPLAHCSNGSCRDLDFKFLLVYSLGTYPNDSNALFFL